MQSRGHGAIAHARINIGRQMVHNLQGKMSQRLLRALDHFARVGLGEGDTEVLSSGFPEGFALGVESVMVVGVAGEEGIERLWAGIVWLRNAVAILISI